MQWPNIKTIDDFARYSLLLFSFISVAFSTYQIIKKKHKRFMFLIPIFFLLIVIQLLINEYVCYLGDITGGKTNATNFSLAIYLIAEDALLLLLIAISSKSLFLKKYSKLTIPIFILLNSLCWLYIPKWTTYLSVVSTTEALLMIFACFYYYYEILNAPPTLNLINEPSFWIVSGVFILFLCITPINLAIESTLVVNYLKSLDSIAYILITLMFLKATSCKAQIKTS